jgi:hypothetical protein
MNTSAEQSVLEFRREHGLDLAPELRKVWLAQLGGCVIPLPNFRWRRDNIAQHDVHHVVTGYPPTFEGELLVAAWETGRRSYSALPARLLATCLALLGLCLSPRRTVSAFRSGRLASGLSSS